MTTTPLTLLRSSPRSLAMAAGWLALLTAAVPQPGWTGGNDLQFPSNGIVCDRGARICYDRMGLSRSMTRREYGKSAERNLTRLISGRPRARAVRFSSGEVCDLRRQICWDDGWQRTNVSKRLSRQLFGDNGGWTRADSRGTDGWDNNRWRPAGTQELGFCELHQRGRRLFAGNCDLQQRASANGPSYRVDFGNGRRYSFDDRWGRLVMVDGTRTWPVTYNRNGSSTEFRWSDLQLVADRNRPIQPSYGNGASSGVLQDLLNSLWR